MEDYSDFLSYLNESQLKLKELLEKITNLHNEAAVGLLETSSLYDPQVLVDITEMTVSGARFDRHIISGQEFLNQLQELTDRQEPIIASQETLQQLEELEKSVAHREVLS